MILLAVAGLLWSAAFFGFAAAYAPILLNAPQRDLR
jgi:hypothetical protein